VTVVLSLSMLAGSVTPAMASAKSARAIRHAKVIAIIKATAKEKKLGNGQIKALLILCRRESGYNPKARNHSCKGLFQLKTKSKKWADPVWNTAKAIRYIKHRYGTPKRALAHSYSHGWY
jgi:SLT domain-containing protein